MFPVIEEFQRSGSTRQDFAEEHNIPVPVLDYWRRKYDDEKGFGDAGFVQIVSDREAAGWEAPRGPHVEIIFRDGMTLRYVGAVDPSLLLKIVERAL